MNLQVLPLRVLVSRQVIRDRMDYTGYLAGKTRSEMDILDRLAGRFVVQASELTVERFFGGDELPAEEWETMRRAMGPSNLINFLDGSSEFSIVETSSSEPRMWDVFDVDGVKKRFPLTSRCRMREEEAKYWVYSDDFIEDGKLMAVKKEFVMLDGKVALVMELHHSFSTDKQGNLVREFICSMPILDIKLTKVMSALRVVSSDRSSLCHCVIL